MSSPCPSQVVLKGASKKLSLLGVSVCFYTPFLLSRARHPGQRAGSDCNQPGGVGRSNQAASAVRRSWKVDVYLKCSRFPPHCNMATNRICVPGDLEFFLLFLKLLFQSTNNLNLKGDLVKKTFISFYYVILKWWTAAETTSHPGHTLVHTHTSTHTQHSLRGLSLIKYLLQPFYLATTTKHQILT